MQEVHVRQLLTYHCFFLHLLQPHAPLVLKMDSILMLYLMGHGWINKKGPDA
jgi:hypothetical protein